MQAGRVAKAAPSQDQPFRSSGHIETRINWSRHGLPGDGPWCPSRARPLRACAPRRRLRLRLRGGNVHPDAQHRSRTSTPTARPDARPPVPAMPARSQGRSPGGSPAAFRPANSRASSEPQAPSGAILLATAGPLTRTCSLCVTGAGCWMASSTPTRLGWIGLVCFVERSKSTSSNAHAAWDACASSAK